MGSAPITDTSPLLERTDGTVTTTFEYHTCETLGLVKMDFLGLSNLTVIRDTLTNIEHNGKGVIDYTKIPLDDRETYQLLSRGDTLGVFQLDSDGMRSLLKTLKPDNFKRHLRTYCPVPTGPDVDGLAHQLRQAQERLAKDYAYPPPSSTSPSSRCSMRRTA